MNLRAAPISTKPPTTLTAFIQSPLRGIFEINPGESASREERKCEHRGEGGKADDRIEEITAGRHDEQPADHRERAGERGDRQRERHEKHADQTAAAFGLGTRRSTGSSAGLARRDPAG